jgi:O-succinylbenzoic acid--CoA ligase
MSRRLVAVNLAGGPEFVDALRRAWDDGDAVFPVDQRLPPPARRAVLGAMAPGAVVDASGTTVLDGAQPVDDGDALVIATSGTTGAPRGVVLTHAAVAASATATSVRLGVTTADHWLACLPLAHVGGLSVVTRALHAGTGLTVVPSFEAGAVRRAVDGGANLVSLVATALARVDASWFRTVVLGGSRPPADVAGNVVVTYGLTETGSGVVYDGVPLDGVDVRLVEQEIHVRGPMLLRAYRDGTDPRRDGWLPTGDVGHWDADGRLVVEGRRGDLIISGGENVWPDAVEAVLRTHAAVADVAVAGSADPEWGEIVVAYVVPAGEPPTLAALRDHVRASVAAFHAPRRLVLVDAIPRTTLGKVARHALPAGG